MTRDPETRALELLADRATEGLGAAEEAELDALLARYPRLDDDSFDLAAAAAALAAETTPPEPMPAILRRRIERQAAEWVGNGAAEDGFEPVSAPVVELSSRRGWRRAVTSPWVGLATAASLVIAVGWFIQVANTPIETECYLTRVPAIAEHDQRTQLLDAPDAIELAWRPTGGAAFETVSGEVVWSSERQRGIVHLRGVRREELPDRLHLWIFEAAGRERPIDGGSLEVDAAGEVLVALALDGEDRVRPLRFELTVEEPEEPEPHYREPVLVASLGTPGTG
jgi:hypothetical protein